MKKHQTSSTAIDHTRTTRRAVLGGLASGIAASAFLAAGWSVDAMARPMLETGGVFASAEPVKIVVVFGRPEDTGAFENYYLTHHLPLALTMPYCSSFENGIAVRDAEGGDAAFYRIATLTFNSEADMVACLTSDVGQAAFADVANFASGGATATIVGGIQSFTPGDDVATGHESLAPARSERRSPE